MHYRLMAKDVMSEQVVTRFLEKLKTAEAGAHITLDLRDAFPMVRGMWSWKYQFDVLDPNIVPGVRRILTALRGNFTVEELNVLLPQSSVEVAAMAAASIVGVFSYLGGWAQMLCIGIATVLLGPTFKSEYQCAQACRDFKEKVLEAITEHLPSLFKYSAVEVYVAEENEFRDNLWCMTPEKWQETPRLSIEGRKVAFQVSQSLGCDADACDSETEDLMPLKDQGAVLHFTSDTTVKNASDAGLCADRQKAFHQKML